jgi:hypothetical protein
MEIKSIFIIISTSLAFISPLVYASSILKGKAKPHRTTRLVLLIITSLTTISLFAQHDRVAIYLAGVSTFQSTLIFFLSIKHGMGGGSKTDILCLIIAIIGIILWKITGSAEIALFFAIGADFTGMIPALIKTYKFPKTEIWQFYGLDCFAAFFSLLAMKEWGIEDFSYPVYILLINLIMVLLIVKIGKR